MSLLFGRRDGIRGLPPGLYVTVDAAEATHRILARDTLRRQKAGERFQVRIVGWPEAPVTSPVERGAQRAASGARHRPQAWFPTSHYYADIAASLALHADAEG